MTKIALFGGWGYGNLGDEILLDAYRRELNGYDLLVVSSDTTATTTAQEAGLEVYSDRRPREVLKALQAADAAIICGGGYLNGWWRREATRKLTLLNLVARMLPTVVHGIEVRHLSLPWQRRLMVELAEHVNALSVRDLQSKNVLYRLGYSASLVPDSVALLTPHRESFTQDVRSSGRVLLHLPSIHGRPDVSEAGFDVSVWPSFSSELVNNLGSTALGLATPSLPASWWRKTYPSLDIVTAQTSGELIGLLAGSAGVVSAPMHPALVASLFGVPSVGIPYNGKVAPTVSALMLESDFLFSPELGVPELLRRLESCTGTPHDALWESAYGKSSGVLRQGLGIDGCSQEPLLASGVDRAQHAGGMSARHGST